MSEQIKVAFNDAHKSLYDELFEKKLISKDFNNFVRDAFYDKIDDIRLKSGLVVDCDQIAKITQDQIMKLSKGKITG
jgi:hypothetical protein